FALKLFGENRNVPVVFVANYTTSAVFARELSPLIIEGVAVAVICRVAKNADVTVFSEEPMLYIVWDVAPNQVTTHTIPGRSFSPGHSGVVSLNCRIADLVLGETWIQDD